jgi:hypothetical protein
MKQSKCIGFIMRKSTRSFLCFGSSNFRIHQSYPNVMSEPGQRQDQSATQQQLSSAEGAAATRSVWARAVGPGRRGASRREPSV